MAEITTMQQLLKAYYNIDVTGNAYAVERVVLSRVREEVVRTIDERLQKKPHSYKEFVAQLAASAFGQSYFPHVAPGIALALKVFEGQASSRAQVHLAQPVHGPFASEVYDDPQFVAHYTDIRFETRVAELERVIRATQEDRFIALGDGAGVMQAVKEKLQENGRIIHVTSYDGSDEMVSLAKRMGYVVTLQTIEQALRGKHEGVYVLSHVTDYMTEEQLQKISKRKVIIYGRATEFHGCQFFNPYDSRWGYQLATSNVKLYGYIPYVPLRVVPQLDYTLFQHPIVHAHKTLSISPDLPLYIHHAQETGLEVREDAAYKIVLNPWDERSACGVPKVGPIGGGIGHSKFVVPPQATLGFFTANNIPILPTPIAVGSSFFCDAERVWINVGYARYWIAPHNVGGVQYYVHTENRGVIEIDRCRCYGKFPHSHLMQIVSDNRVELVNLVNECRRRYRGAVNRKNLFSTYCDSGGTTDVVEARFLHMERVMDILYDTQGNLVDREGEG